MKKMSLNSREDET